MTREHAEGGSPAAISRPSPGSDPHARPCLPVSGWWALSESFITNGTGFLFFLASYPMECMNGFPDIEAVSHSAAIPTCRDVLPFAGQVDSVNIFFRFPHQ